MVHIYISLMKKTKGQTLIKLPEKAITIIKEIQPAKRKTKKRHIFPMFLTDLNHE